MKILQVQHLCYFCWVVSWGLGRGLDVLVKGLCDKGLSYSSFILLSFILCLCTHVVCVSHSAHV